MFTFYLDENLHGETFASVLRAAGISIELCKDHHFSGVDDTIWIPEIAARGWIIVTGDVKTRHKSWERQVIIGSSAKMIHVRSGKNATHRMLAQNFVNTLPRIEAFLNKNPAPCLATLTRPSKLEDYRAGKPGNINKQKLTM